jgi:hypothetical protein
MPSPASLTQRLNAPPTQNYPIVLQEALKISENTFYELFVAARPPLSIFERRGHGSAVVFPPQIVISPSHLLLTRLRARPIIIFVLPMN